MNGFFGSAMENEYAKSASFAKFQLKKQDRYANLKYFNLSDESSCHL